MEIVMYIGLVVAIVGGIGLLIAAFKTSVWWGLGSLLLGPVALIYVIMHWSEAKNPFLLQLGGLVVMFVGAYSSGALGS